MAKFLKTEVNKRKQLAALAMFKYRKIRKNRFINASTKFKVHNIYVRSILRYNRSTWVTKKTNYSTPYSRDIYKPVMMSNTRT